MLSLVWATLKPETLYSNRVDVKKNTKCEVAVCGIIHFEVNINSDAVVS